MKVIRLDQDCLPAPNKKLQRYGQKAITKICPSNDIFPLSLMLPSLLEQGKGILNDSNDRDRCKLATKQAVHGIIEAAELCDIAAKCLTVSLAAFRHSLAMTLSAW
jgi:hypothetical protein